MPRRNPFEESQPREQVKGEEIINTRTQRMTRIIGPDGIVQEFVTDLHDSRPDENGGYIDTEVTNVITDHAGNTFPEDPHSLEAISYSGLFVNSQEQRAMCTSRLHGNGPRNILIGQDGRLTSNGTAICSRCDFWLGTIYFTIGVLVLGVILGIWRGAGIF